MAKVKRTRVKRAKKKVKVRAMRTNRPASVRQNMVPQIEKSVRDYVALLKDPCNGPLVGPVGASANGYITRFERTITVNPTHGTFVMKWVPGGLSFTGANSGGLYVGESATGTGALTFVASDGDAPGFSFLSTTCGKFRCLAACLQVRYTGTEVNRGGIVGSSICAGNRLIQNTGDPFSITVDRQRVPDQSLEVLWQPSDGDEDFTPNLTTSLDAETTARKNGILLAGANCPANTISIRMVVVYQWTPGTNDSMILPVPSPGTGVTMARVIQLARQAGFIAGHLLKGYSTGGLYGVAKQAASIIRPSIRLMR